MDIDFVGIILYGILVFLIVGSIYVAYIDFTRRASVVLGEREDFSEAWNSLDIDNDLIDEFLCTIVEEFGFKREFIYRLSPSDTLEGIYKIEYPGWGPDCCETETLISLWEKEYQFFYPENEEDYPEDGITLREILDTIEEKRSQKI